MRIFHIIEQRANLYGNRLSVQRVNAVSGQAIDGIAGAGIIIDQLNVAGAQRSVNLQVGKDVYKRQALNCMKNDSFQGKTVVISGSGNVAIFATEKATQLGGKVVALSDSNGYIYDKDGIHLDLVKEIKLARRGRIKEYVNQVPSAEYHEGCSGIWSIPCDIALPCATQNEIDEAGAKLLVANGCKVVCEGANMPSTPEAINVYLENGVLYGPAKAANAGGVATSGLEMSQNSLRLSWTFEEVDERLKGDVYKRQDVCYWW